MTQAAFHFASADAAATIQGTGLAAAAAESRNVLEFDLVKDVVSLAALEPEWNSLLGRIGSPTLVFQTFGWNWLWCRHYLAQRFSDAELAVVVGRKAGRLVLVLPLVVERRAGLRQLAWMGDPVSQYGDLIAAPEVRAPHILEEAWRFAAGATRADLANLRKVRADAVAATVLDRLGARVVAVAEAPYVSFGKGEEFASCEAQISAKGRKNRRRHMRRLQELGEVTFIAPSGAEAVRLAELAIAMKRGSLASKGQLSRAFADDRLAQFFAEAASGSVRDVDCKVTAICCGEDTAAVEITLDHARHRFLHIAVYDERFEKCGVGGLLLEHALRQSFDDGIDRFDLLAPKHGYKMEFCVETVEICDHTLAFSMCGRLYCAVWLGLRPRLKRLLESLPAPARRLAAKVMDSQRRSQT